MELEKFLGDLSDLFAQIHHLNSLVYWQFHLLYLHAVISPSNLRFGYCLALLFLFFHGRAYQIFPSVVGVKYNRGESLCVVVADKGARECEVVSWRMVLLDGDELSFGDGVGEDGVELGVSEEAGLGIGVGFLYFFEGFHGYGILGILMKL